MILIAHDEKPKDLHTYYNGLAERAQLDDLDYAFYGHEVAVGIERKKVPNLITDILNGHLMEQIRRARDAYDIIYFICEGPYRKGEDGLVEHPIRGGWRLIPPGIEYYRLEGFLEDLAVIEQVRVAKTASVADTVHKITQLYHWWGKPIDKHQATSAFYKEASPAHLVGRMSLTRRIAKELPGIDWKLSQKVEKQFLTPLEMVNADEEVWMKIEGIGKGKASKIVKGLRGGI